MLKGLNHLTLAVSNVARSLAFYRDVLGMTAHARWDGGAYLSCGSLWLCLSQDAARQPQRARDVDYTHYAFTLEAADFQAFVDRLTQAGISAWKDNKSEGDSYYFLDPDGHKLEVHVGDLRQRLAACRAAPYAGMVFYDQE
ncbi:fosfomycin resistance glutathione transferase [Entomohabitans teleogrylli]|uniref:fosfomycin resistance glutathione transferase n=1 Tax=Entomohabitans teleogrylli TaxID=1384589 RepID=UPI00073DA601|nr:fosfomycin resistance glutathione transferase [Entomohabitans teleogrylli]